MSSGYADSYGHHHEVCTRWVGERDVIGAACPVCGHSDFVHPGRANPGAGLESCVVCELLELRDLLKEKADAGEG